MYDILIQNGRVIDPKNNLDEILDIIVHRGKIHAIGKFEIETCHKVLNADGCIVTPGLIDFHTHIWPLAEIGIPSEIVCFSSGITSAVDAGSCGCDTFEQHMSFINTSLVEVKCFLNVSSSGLSAGENPENINSLGFDKMKIKALFEKYPNELLGLKIRYSKEIVKEHGLVPLSDTIKIANEIGVPIVVHFTNSPFDVSEILKLLRKGDVLTHAFHGIGNTILNESGKVSQSVIEARGRGVIFDVANARFHFAFKTARAALSEGFYPDIISTDLTQKSLFKKPQIFNMMFLLSKYINLGLSLNDVISKCTLEPAKFMNSDHRIGCLTVGSEADIAIIKLIDRDVHFEDWEGGLLEGHKLLNNMVTIKTGKVVYMDMDFEL